MNFTPEITHEILNAAGNLANLLIKEGLAKEKAMTITVDHFTALNKLSMVEQARLRASLEKKTNGTSQSQKADVKIDTIKSSVLYRMVAPGRFAPVAPKTFPSKLAEYLRRFNPIAVVFNKIKWKSFAMGILFGALLGFGSVYFLGQRYRIQPLHGVYSVRLDTWTGQSWMTRPNYSNGWDWEPIREPDKSVNQK